jgi:glycosyltransferase involved in cell wall biosynthesis
MKICMFTNTYLPHVGGVARSVHFFTQDLRDRGHEVLVVAPTFPEAREIGSIQDGVLRVPAIQNFNGSDFSVRIPMPFIIDQKIDRFQPDIVHSHHPFLLGDAAMRAARYRRLPLVFTHHTLYERYTHYVSADSEAMKRFAIHLSTEYANLCTHVVAPSESVARLIRKRGVERPIAEIPTGVDVSFFREGRGDRLRKEASIPDDVRVIGHLGRLAPEKNLGYLTEAVVRHMRTDEKSRFLVVGSGPSEETIKDRFQEEGMGDRLVMAGKLTGRSLADAYRAMDLFVFSSRSETQGMVLTEAMAAGRPVIALDASGAREVVRDRENGRLLPADTPPESFAEAIGAFFKYPETAKNWGNAAVETAEAFSRMASAEKMERLYDDVLSDHREDATHLSMDRLEEMIQGVKTEWELLGEKAAAVASLIKKDDRRIEASLD